MATKFRTTNPDDGNGVYKIGGDCYEGTNGGILKETIAPDWAGGLEFDTCADCEDDSGSYNPPSSPSSPSPPPPSSPSSKTSSPSTPSSSSGSSQSCQFGVGDTVCYDGEDYVVKAVQDFGYGIQLDINPSHSPNDDTQGTTIPCSDAQAGPCGSTPSSAPSSSSASPSASSSSSSSSSGSGDCDCGYEVGDCFCIDGSSPCSPDKLAEVTAVNPVDGCEDVTNSSHTICELSTTLGTIEVTLAGATKMNGNLVFSNACPNECPNINVGDCYTPLQNNPFNTPAGTVTAVTQVNTADIICIINISNGTTINVNRYGTNTHYSEAEFGDCPSSCSLSGNGGYFYPAPTPCGAPSSNLATSTGNLHPDGYVTRTPIGQVGIVESGGVCYTLGTYTEVDECEYQDLIDDGIPESSGTQFSATSYTSCECCQIANDPTGNSSDCEQFYDNLGNLITGLETYDSSVTYSQGAEVWAQNGVGGSYSKYRLVAGTTFNIHPSQAGNITTCGCQQGSAGCSQIQCTQQLYNNGFCDECDELYDFSGTTAQGTAGEYSKLASSDDVNRFQVTFGTTIWVIPRMVYASQNVAQWQIVCTCSAVSGCGTQFKAKCS